MLEDFFMEELVKLDAEADKQVARIWDWLRKTYSTTLEMHINNKIFTLKVLAFGRGERSAIKWVDNLPANDMMGKILVKRKVFLVTAESAAAGSLSMLRGEGYEIPWITAAMRRNKDNKIAWMLGVKNGVVYTSYREGGVMGYAMVCDQVSEMMPKDLVAVPDALQF
jgi:hypothetical protein